MDKKSIQKRVLKDGKPLSLSKFNWCSKTGKFSSDVDGLVIDFKSISNLTINVCNNNTIDVGSNNTINAVNSNTINATYSNTINAGSNNTINVGNNNTINATYNNTIKVGKDCVIVRRDVFEVIQPACGDTITIFPYGKKGYLTNGMYNGKPHIIADGIVSEIINKKGNVYKVKNLGEHNLSWLIENNGVYSHGSTLKQAKDDLVYKLSDRDTSMYLDYTLDTIVTKDAAIKMYMDITGACGTGTKYFVNGLGKTKANYTVREVIGITTGQYNHSTFVDFFNKD